MRGEVDDVPVRAIAYQGIRKRNGVAVKQTGVVMTWDLRRKVRDIAYEMKTNMSRAILRAVAEYLNAGAPGTCGDKALPDARLMTLYVEESVLEDIKRVAEEKGCSLSALVRTAVEWYYEKYQKEKGAIAV